VPLEVRERVNTTKATLVPTFIFQWQNY